MANFSLFGASGFDPLGTQAQSAMQFAWNGKDMRRNIRYQKKLMRFQNSLAREQASWSARNMPSETVAGLRAANLNPLLAFSDFNGLSSSMAQSASVPSAIGDSSYSADGSTSGYDHSAYVQQRNAKRLGEAEVEGAESAVRGTKADTELTYQQTQIARSEAQSAKARARVDQAKADVDLQNLRYEHDENVVRDFVQHGIIPVGKGLVFGSDAWKKRQDIHRNRQTADWYNNHPVRSIGRDVGDVVSGVSSVVDTVNSARSGAAAIKKAKAATELLERWKKNKK